MFGLFESYEKRRTRLLEEFFALHNNLMQMPERDQIRANVAVGEMLKKIEQEVAHPLTLGPADSKALAKKLRATAESASPMQAMCINLIAVPAELFSENDSALAEFRAGVEQFFWGAEFDYGQFLSGKLKL